MLVISRNVGYKPGQLTNLEVEGQTLNPTFSPAQGSYNLRVSNDVHTITVKAAAEPGFTVEGTGQQQLEVGLNTIKVTVKNTAEADGETSKREYTILVIRDKPTPTADMFDFTPPTNLTYDGQPKTATVKLKDTSKNVGEIRVFYRVGQESLFSAYDAGTYTVTISTSDTTDYGPATGLTDNSWTFTIAPATLPNDAVLSVYPASPKAGDVLRADLYYDLMSLPCDYQWTIGERSVSATDSYTVKPEDGGKTIKVTATATGNYKGSLSKEIEVAKTPFNGSVTITADKNAIGTDTVLTAKPSGFPNNVKYTYQWYNNSVEIADATGDNYTVKEGDKSLSVKVTLDSTTYEGSATSAAVEVGKTMLSGTLTIASSSTSAAKVGDTLTAKLNDTDISAENYTIAWLRDGTPITGANASTYTVATADKGKAITVQVTAKSETVSGSLVSASGVSVAATAPGAPTNLTATVDHSSIRLEWSAPQDDGGSPILHYEVLVDGGTDKGGITATAPNCIWGYGFEAGTEHTFTVAAVNAVGTSTPVTIEATASGGSTGGSGGSSSSGGGGGGGGGGSSSSGGSTNTPSTSGGTTSVGVTPSVSNGSATATVSSSSAQTMVSDAAKNNSDNVTVKVNVPSGSTADSVTANVPASAVASLAKDTNASLTVDSPVAGVTIPNSALSALGGTSGNVTVTAAKNGTDSVTITVQKGGQTVGALSGGMRVDVPVSAAAAQAGSGLVAVLVNADGTQTVLPKSTLSGGEMKVLLDSGNATLKFVDNSKSFVDTGAHWASSAVDFVSSRDLFQGTSPSEFSPDMPMNRAMLVTVLHRLESEPNASAYSFNDVPTDSYYAEATAWAVGMGITNGMDGAFNGDGTITREMLATMLYRYVQGTNGSKGTSGSYASMGDAGQVNTWADDAMRWAVGSGIITGDNGNLRPGDPASRAEVATMLERFVTVIAK